MNEPVDQLEKKAPNTAYVQRLKRRVVRLERRRYLYIRGINVILVLMGAETIAGLLRDGPNGQLQPGAGIRVAIYGLFSLFFYCAASSIPFTIRVYEQTIENVLASYGELEALAAIVRARAPFALLLRNFAVESQYTKTIITDPVAGGSDVIDYQVVRDIYKTLLPVVEARLPLFTLLNQRDYSPSWIARRVDVGDDWWRHFETYAREAKILVVLALNKLSPSLKKELKWLHANNAGNRSIVITQACLHDRVKQILPPASIVVIPTLENFSLFDPERNWEGLSRSVSELAELVSRLLDARASTRSP